VAGDNNLAGDLPTVPLADGTAILELAGDGGFIGGGLGGTADDRHTYIIN
jgi:hypothetical protein